MSERERRRHLRYEVEGLTGRLDGEHPFEVLKLSMGGLLVKMRRRQEPPLDTVAEIELTLDGQLLRCQAQVVFVGPDMESEHSSDLYRIGLAFTSPSSAARRGLKQYIERAWGPA